MSDGALRKITNWVRSHWWPHHQPHSSASEVSRAIYVVRADELDRDGDLDLLPILGELFAGQPPSSLAELEVEMDATPVFPCRWLPGPELAKRRTFTLRLGREVRQVRLARADESCGLERNEPALLTLPKDLA